ncbi:sodium/hydrogen exchanger 9B2-like, partial [Aplysia californica]|uniref:Sodium/hydrogen exchanger 9B2-like n=1 Tax=Aplysia californica TaxID=6500 RepID=A0ABM1ADT2_APLCA
SMALTVILTRAGLGLDPVALKRLSLVVLRLAFCPSIAEALVDGVAAHLILGFPWTWSFLLATVIQNKHTCLLFSSDLVWTLFKGPLEAVVGIIVGSLGGLVLWYLPQKSSKNLVLFRSVMLIGGGMLTIFGSKAVKWSGSGPLGCLSLAFVAAYGWREDYRDTGRKNPVEDVTGVLWMVFQPLLFGLIGAAVDISSLDPNTVGLGIAVLFMGLTVRLIVAFLTVLRTDLNLKERFFIPCSWFPKATVQAAIGAIAYDTAIDKGATELVPLGKKQQLEDAI